MAIIKIEGNDLKALLANIEAVIENQREVYSIRIEPRADGVAIKVNAGMWSPSLGKKEV